MRAVGSEFLKFRTPFEGAVQRVSEIVFGVSTCKDRMGLGFTVWRAECLTIVGHLVGVCLQMGILGVCGWFKMSMGSAGIRKADSQGYMI